MPSLATPQVAESLARQVAYVGANVEDDVLGNHVIRNARALVLGGRALGDAAALERGLALLGRELPEQVLSDGGHYERSPVYHLVVLRDLLEVRAASEAAWLDEPIERMQRFAAGLQRPDGAPALFNDGTLDLAPQLDLPEPAPGLSVFEETGYAVLREPGLWLAFDCGPPAPAFLPAHAHADALSFQLWLDGRPVVVDPGTSTYDPGAQRDIERSTAAHATIALDGRSQFELWGAFRSGPLPRVRLLGTEPLAAEVVWPSGARHRRTIGWDEREIRVDDELELAVADASAQLAAAGRGRRSRGRAGRRAGSGNRGAIHLGASLRPPAGYCSRGTRGRGRPVRRRLEDPPAALGCPL